MNFYRADAFTPNTEKIKLSKEYFEQMKILKSRYRPDELLFQLIRFTENGVSKIETATDIECEKNLEFILSTFHTFVDQTQW